jgi:hypothetical protein
MAIRRVSAGQYTDGVHTVWAKTLAEATRLLGGGSSSNKKPTAPTGTGAQGKLPEQVYSNDLKLNTPSDVLNTGLAYNQQQAIQGNKLTNPNQMGPFANQNVTYDPVTGQPTVNTQLSQGNQNVVGGYQGAAGSANNALSRVLNDGLFTGNSDNSALTKSIFGQLTQGVDDQKQKEMTQLGQTLANRGIPVGSKLYNDQMDQLGKRYDDIYSNARYQSVQQGNQYGLQAAGQLANIGRSGYFDPNLQQFQSQPYSQVDVGSIFNTLQGTQLGEKQIAGDLQKARLGYGGRGGSGGGGNSNPYPDPVVYP